MKEKESAHFARNDSWGVGRGRRGLAGDRERGHDPDPVGTSSLRAYNRRQGPERARCVVPLQGNGANRGRILLLT